MTKSTLSAPDRQILFMLKINSIAVLHCFGSIGLQISAPSADVDRLYIKLFNEHLLISTIFTSHILGYLVVRMGTKHNGHHALSGHCR